MTSPALFKKLLPVCFSSILSAVVEDIVFGAGSRGINAQASQIGHMLCRQRLAAAATFPRSYTAQPLDRGDGPGRSLHDLALYPEYDENLFSNYF